MRTPNLVSKARRRLALGTRLRAAESQVLATRVRPVADPTGARANRALRVVLRQRPARQPRGDLQVPAHRAGHGRPRAHMGAQRPGGLSGRWSRSSPNKHGFGSFLFNLPSTSKPCPLRSNLVINTT